MKLSCPSCCQSRILRSSRERLSRRGFYTCLCIHVTRIRSWSDDPALFSAPFLFLFLCVVVATRFLDFDLDNDGTVGRREFMRALNLALQESGDEPMMPYHGFNVDDFISKEEAMSLMVHLDTSGNGRISWEVKYFPPK